MYTCNINKIDKYSCKKINYEEIYDHCKAICPEMQSVIEYVRNISSSNNYKINILRKSPSISYLLSNSGVKHNDKYISGIKANTNIDSLINNISSINATLLKMFDAKGNSKVSGIFKTGDKVNIKSGNEEANFEVVIYGDINGDGVIDKLDAASVLRQYYKYVNYDGVYKVAADVNKDGVIDKLDAASILRDWYGYAKIEG